jgi:major membrane immunogen (membrane-anchored lipoprotein)
MKRKIAMLAATSVLACSSLLVGCDRTISKTESSSVSSDGTVKSKEQTVTEKSDGTVIKKEETKKTTPNP